MKTFKKLLSNESGATAIEYGLIAALLAIIIIAVMSTVQGDLEATFSVIGDSLRDPGQALEGDDS